MGPNAREGPLMCSFCGQRVLDHTSGELCRCGLAEYAGNDLYMTEMYRRLAEAHHD